MTQPALYSPAALAGLLEKALGKEPAEMLVRDAIKVLAINPKQIDGDGALAILDQIAAQPGLPGVCARFAKARLHLAVAT